MKGIEILEQAAQKYNSMDLGDYKFEIPLDKELPLYGAWSPLDSLGFTAFLMAVEDEIEDRSGKKHNLTTQEVMDRAGGIFWNVRTLACFLDGLNGYNPSKNA